MFSLSSTGFPNSNQEAAISAEMRGIRRKADGNENGEKSYCWLGYRVRSHSKALALVLYLSPYANCWLSCLQDNVSFWTCPCDSYSGYRGWKSSFSIKSLAAHGLAVNRLTASFPDSFRAPLKQTNRQTDSEIKPDQGLRMDRKNLDQIALMSFSPNLVKCTFSQKRSWKTEIPILRWMHLSLSNDFSNECHSLFWVERHLLILALMLVELTNTLTQNVFPDWWSLYCLEII